MDHDTKKKKRERESLALKKEEICFWQEKKEHQSYFVGIYI
jgi:hypothetical protein